MKNFVVLLIVCLFSVVSFAQDVKKPKYKVKGDLVQTTLYHDNGAIAQTGFYTTEGKLHGEWNSFDVNGNKTATAFYNEGMKTGTWMFFQDNEKKEVRYTNSKISEVKTWKVTDTRVVSN